MKIVVVHPRYCIRAQKQLEGLLENKKLEVVLLIDANKYGSQLSELVKNNVELHSLKFRDSWYRKYSLLKLMKKVTVGADLIHCHNEPDYHVVQILSQFKGKIPIVYDIHDLASMRSGKEIKDEATAYKEVDAIIHISDQILYHAEEKYGKQNTHIIMSLPSRKNIIRNTRQRTLKAPYKFVYQGGLVDVGNEKSELFAYRHYLEIFRSILEEGHTLHAFPTNAHERLPAYKQLENEFSTFKMHHKIPYQNLLGKMSEYDFGLVGFNMNYPMEISTRKYLNAVLGNKVFDYIFAGIPVVTINAEAMSDFAISNKCGVDKADSETWSEAINRGVFRADLETVAEQNCMENQVDKLWGIYQDLI